jgi:hypothetical protein
MRSLVEFVIIFVTTETPNTINSRTLVLASYGGGKLTVKCPSPETLRGGFPVRVRLGTVRKEGRGTLQVIVRPVTVRKGGVRSGAVRERVQRVLRVCKRAL